MWLIDRALQLCFQPFLVDWVKSYLVNKCFLPSQPVGIIAGLGETFIKRYTVKMTNEAEIRPEEQSEGIY